MVIKFKYNQKELVYYIWRSYIGGETAAIGNGIVEKQIYDSGWVYASKKGIREMDSRRPKWKDPNCGVPQYCIRIATACWITIPEPEVFRTYREARSFAKVQGIRVYSSMVRMKKNVKLFFDLKKGKWVNDL